MTTMSGPAVGAPGDLPSSGFLPLSLPEPRHAIDHARLGAPTAGRFTFLVSTDASGACWGILPGSGGVALASVRSGDARIEQLNSDRRADLGVLGSAVVTLRSDRSRLTSGPFPGGASRLASVPVATIVARELAPDLDPRGQFPERNSEMARGHHVPEFWVVVEQVQTLVKMRTVHVADGEIQPEEEVRERVHITRLLLPTAVKSADNQTIAQTIARYGPECDSARRMMKRRAERMANVLPFPDRDDDSPDDDGAALTAA